jgi:hypothetical protein
VYIPIDETPFEQDVLAVALKFTGELTVLLFAGALTDTPDEPPPLTVIVIGVVEAPPQ